MRVKYLSACIVAATTLGASSLVSAEYLDRAFYIGGQGARLWYDDKFSSSGDRPDDHALYGGQLGMRFTRHFSAELSYVEGDTEFRGNPSREIDTEIALLSLRWHMANQSAIEPYLGIAGGNFRVDPQYARESHDETVGGPELGVQTRLFRNLMLDLGARGLYSFDNERWHGQAYAGLNLLFGVKESSDAKVVEVIEPLPEPVVEPTPVVEKQPEPQIVKRDVNEVHSAHFAFDSATLSADNRADLVSAARFLRDNPNTRVTLEGHTCSIGASEYNQYLSERRAEAAADLLQSEGVDRSRISVVGKGEREPIADNATRSGREQNRRVEAIITGTVEERR